MINDSEVLERKRDSLEKIATGRNANHLFPITSIEIRIKPTSDANSKSLEIVDTLSKIKIEKAFIYLPKGGWS